MMWWDFTVRKDRIARKFYRAGIVPQSGVGLDHPTWKEVRFDHFLMVYVAFCLTYRTDDFLTTFQTCSW